VSQGCASVGLRQVGQTSFRKKYVAYYQFDSQLSVIPEKMSVTIPFYRVQTEAAYAVQKLLV